MRIHLEKISSRAPEINSEFFNYIMFYTYYVLAYCRRGGGRNSYTKKPRDAGRLMNSSAIKIKKVIQTRKSENCNPLSGRL